MSYILDYYRQGEMFRMGFGHDEKQKMVICQTCGEPFTTTRALRSHRTQKH